MKNLVAIVLLCSLFSCQRVYRNKKDKHATHDHKLKQIGWMVGKWEMKTPEGTITEEWQQASDKQLTGISYMITQAGDTPFRESIKLNYEGDSLYYKPTVSNQNEGKEIQFSEKSIADNIVVFENKRHDFPQRIIYKRTSDSTIVATIEGEQGGQTKKAEFAYTRAR